MLQKRVLPSAQLFEWLRPGVPLNRSAFCAIGVVVVSLTLMQPAQGQLSPGALSAPHSSLDSLLQCTSCHALGGRAELKCTTCHTDIQERIVAERGYHARLLRATDSSQDCASCHAEHFGRDFDIVRWPTSRDAFDHRETGYPLMGKHASATCSQCHTSENITPAEAERIVLTDLDRTYLGLSTTCLSCHENEHESQLSEDCATCHSFDSWTPAVRFNHDSSRFPLTGLHQAVTCDGCHSGGASSESATQYVGVAFAMCSACHMDPHVGAFETTCVNCHETSGWMNIAGRTAFDHDEADFPLEGGHEGLSCSSCHATSNFSSPVSHAMCLDCHDDYHQGQFLERADRGDCGACHDVTRFEITTFTAARHQESQYPLLGMHEAVDCDSCHVPAAAATDYHPESRLCLDCHNDPHDGQFDGNLENADCASCHSENGFRPSTFTISRHNEGRFPLTGAHAAVVCFNCHTPESTEDVGGIQFVFEDRSCESCHDDPHRLTASIGAGRNGAERVEAAICESCHRTGSWNEIRSFDHGVTRFALLGSHERLSCASCHRLGPNGSETLHMVFDEAPLECSSCHADPHAGQFDALAKPALCTECHTEQSWSASLFDHSRDSEFQLEGAHTDVPCALCHMTRESPEGATVRMYAETPKECAQCH